MQLRCTVPFGNFAVGDDVNVPDDVTAFDRDHFEEVKDKAAPKAASEKDGD